MTFATGLAVAARVAVFVFLIFVPINDQDGFPVSPVHVQKGTDVDFYSRSAEYYKSVSLTALLDRFTGYYDLSNERGGGDGNLLSPSVDYFIAPPLFPMLIAGFDYREGNSLPLSLAFLAISCAVAALWIRWLAARGVSWPWLAVLALLPNPIWFTVSLSTDLIFAATFAVFFVSYFRERWTTGSVIVWGIALVLCMLTRPNAVSLLLFVAADFFLFRSSAMRGSVRITLGIAAFASVGLAAFLLAPHFVIYARDGQTISYFGANQSAYLLGVLGDLPTLIDRFFSAVLLLLAKLLYFAGLRPSYGDTLLALVGLRSMAGVWLLPGLIYLFLRADKSVRLMVALYITPVLIGASQDRYNLAILPILYFYGLLAWRSAVGRFFVHGRSMRNA